MTRIKAAYSNRRTQEGYKYTFVHKNKEKYFFLFDYFDLRYQYILASSVSYVYVRVYDEPYAMLAYFKERFDNYLKNMEQASGDFLKLRECSQALGAAIAYQNFDAKRKELINAYNEGCRLIQAMDPLISMGRVEQFVKDDDVMGINKWQGGNDRYYDYGEDFEEVKLNRNEYRMRLNMLRNIVMLNEFNANSRRHLYLVWSLLMYLREPEYSHEG